MHLMGRGKTASSAGPFHRSFVRGYDAHFPLCALVYDLFDSLVLGIAVNNARICFFISAVYIERIKP